ncbi:MAG: hypothetical protein IJ524_02270 [Bacteroidales bacterium]|nr:hypothetical protein [Bacteroidales bacterium]
MKKTITLAVMLLAACVVVVAQGYTTLGVGISTPKGTLHVHSNEKHFYEPGLEPPAFAESRGTHPLRH